MCKLHFQATKHKKEMEIILCLLNMSRKAQFLPATTQLAFYRSFQTTGSNSRV